MTKPSFFKNSDLRGAMGKYLYQKWWVRQGKYSTVILVFNAFGNSAFDLPGMGRFLGL